MQVVRIGLDLAKYVFEVHGVDELGNVVIRRTLRRGSVATFFANLAPCLVGMEASKGAAGLVNVHVLGVLFSSVEHGENLVRVMINGRKRR